MHARVQPVESQPSTPVLFDLSGAVASFREPLSIAGWVFAPSTLTKTPRVVLCFPGTSYTKAYCHLEVPGFGQAAYSCALALAKSGCVVICLDHLGVGDSSMPDGSRLTLATMARTNAMITRHIQEHVTNGTLIDDLPPIPAPIFLGVGHSMGAFLLVEQQATSRSFAGIALLGYTNGSLIPRGDSTLLDLAFPHARYPEYLTVDREGARALFHPGIPAQVVQADNQVASAVPSGILRAMQHPEEILPKAALINVPVFLANADRDLSADFHREPASYPAARDISLFQLLESGHCHHFAPTRRVLWRRLAQWCQEPVRPVQLHHVAHPK
jgi:alpha-beta hydrolase superfamily lysophospholipase